jgi:hypothetical protein
VVGLSSFSSPLEVLPGPMRQRLWLLVRSDSRVGERYGTIVERLRSRLGIADGSAAGGPGPKLHVISK